MHEEINKIAEKEHAFFLYDLNIMNKQINSLSNLPKNIEIFYAMKANPNSEVVSFALNHPLINGIEIASQGEAEKVLLYQQDLKKVIYTSPGKRKEELLFAIKNKIQLINVESLIEAHRIQELSEETQPILLRINTNREIHGAISKMSSSSSPSQFGVSEEEAIHTINEIKKLNKISLKGLHIFSATGVLNASSLLEHIDYAFNLVNNIEKKTNSHFSTIDFGGGIGVDYEGSTVFDINHFANGLKAIIEKYKMQDKRLILELGRYLVADMGYFCTKINDIKISKGKKILICTAGINAHRRPYAMKVNYPVEILNRGENIIYPNQPECNMEFVQINGPLCTEADTLSYNTFVKNAKIGDFVIMKKSGAYGLSMSAKDFLSHPHVHEFVIGEKNAK